MNYDECVVFIDLSIPLYPSFRIHKVSRATFLENLVKLRYLFAQPPSLLDIQRLKISRFPAYERILKLGRERPGALFLDIGCCCEFPLTPNTR